MKTEILKVKGDWLEVLNDCRSTVGKDAAGKEPTPAFKQKILIAEHSPIRDISYKWSWKHIKSWIATHYSRHKWECFIRTQRSDRTGIPRDELAQGTPVTFTGEANLQSLIDTMRKRLCYQAAKETREYAEDLKMAITCDDHFVGDMLVPNCVYRCGCPELKTCGLWKQFTDWLSLQGLTTAISIQERYDAYSEFIKCKENDHE